jgi:hypothetical protein
MHATYEPVAWTLHYVAGQIEDTFYAIPGKCKSKSGLYNFFIGKAKVKL